MKIAILVSTYNWPQALELSIRSILHQTQLPDEIIIADDGSDNKTKELIERLRQESPVSIIHVWQEDKGFRKTTILNKAIATTQCDYILQVDGDVIISPYFVSDHMEIAQPGYFVCGSRVKLSPQITQKVFSEGLTVLKPWNLSPDFVLNSFRSRFLRHFLAERYARKIDHLRGCNMAFWRNDIIKVNGYNENLTQWGHEDGDLGYRLYFAGVKKKALKMGGIVYHLYHQESSKDNEGVHLQELERVKRFHVKWCDNGINKYLH